MPPVMPSPHVPDEPLYGPGRSIPERTDGVPLDLLRDLPQHVDLLQVGITLSRQEGGMDQDLGGGGVGSRYSGPPPMRP